MTRTGKVTVVGAGFYGSTTAQRLAEYDIFDEVVLTDIVEGKPEGLALDMNQSRPVEGFETKVTGQTTGPAGEGYEAIAGSGIVVITAGLPRKPGMSRMDLIGVNAKIVRSVTEQVVKHAPEAVLIVVSNPLDEMTALAAKVSGFPAHRVMGQAGMLDTARFSYFVAERLGVPVGSVRTLTLGSHGDTMVPVPSACTVDGKPLADLLPAADIEALVQRTRDGGGEIVGLLKTGSAYYAPSAAAARMARAVAEDSGDVLPVCAWVDGEYGISGVYLGVEAEIGRTGDAPGGGAGPDRVRAGRAAGRRPRRSGPSRPTSRACSGSVSPAASRRSASSASSVAPSASTASSKTASAEWLNGAVAGSASGGQAPSMRNAPGTCSSTNEKSSDPVTGSGVRTKRPPPNKSATARSAKATSAASLTVTG